MSIPTVATAQQHVHFGSFIGDAAPKYNAWIEANFFQRVDDVRAIVGTDDAHMHIASASWGALLDAQLSDACSEEVSAHDYSHSRDEGLSYIAAVFNNTIMEMAETEYAGTEDSVDIRVQGNSWPPEQWINDGLSVTTVAASFGASVVSYSVTLLHAEVNEKKSLVEQRAILRSEVNLLECAMKQAATHVELGVMLARWNSLERCFGLVDFAKRVLNAPINENVPAGWPHVLAEVHQEHMEYLELSTERGECEGIA
jgi:hypothetical protein